MVSTVGIAVSCAEMKKTPPCPDSLFQKLNYLNWECSFDFLLAYLFKSCLPVKEWGFFQLYECSRKGFRDCCRKKIQQKSKGNVDENSDDTMSLAQLL